MLRAHDVARDPGRERRQGRGLPQAAAPEFEQQGNHRVLREVVGQVGTTGPGEAEGPHAGPEPAGQFGLGLGVARANACHEGGIVRDGHGLGKRVGHRRYGTRLPYFNACGAD